MKYKLIAIDMDGTLLDSSNKISERTIKTIKKAEEKGIYIVIATGRILKSAINHAESLRLKKPLIACNGAIIIDKFKNIINESPLEKSKVKEIINIGMLENIYFHFYDKDSFYSNTRSEEILKFYDEGSKKLKIDVNIFSDVDEILDREDLKIYKFIFVDDDKEKLKKLRDRINQLEGIETSSSWADNIELMSKNVSKGKAVEFLCDKLNIRPEEVMAIGDNENDLSMIEYAGLGVAMGNATEKMKERADYITSTNDEDGLAKAIEKFILV